jgi:hypothetical protein
LLIACGNVCALYRSQAEKERHYDASLKHLGNENISLDDLVITEVLFRPHKTHLLELVGGGRSVSETIENVSDFGRCHHTVMQCRKMGVIVDFSGGKLTGSMFPVVYPHMEAFTKALPGQLLSTFPCSEESIQRQISQDYNKANQSRDFLPPRFTQRVLRSADEKKVYCWNCLGTASTDKPLRKCLGCPTNASIACIVRGIVRQCIGKNTKDSAKKRLLVENLTFCRSWTSKV